MNIYSHFRKHRVPILLGCILLVAFSVRSFGRNWDEGGHLHPDERMLVMVADRIHFPDNLNPDFFNYGSLPIYILRASAQAVDIVFRSPVKAASYDGMLFLGRTLSSLFDVSTVLLVFYITYQLSKKTSAGLLAALLYSITFFPIQNSHFFVVDVFLTFFITALMAALVWYGKKERFWTLVLMSICMGAAIATKFTALVFMPGIVFSLTIIHLFAHSSTLTMIHKVRNAVFSLVFFCVLSVVCFAVFMPFAFLSPSGILSRETIPIASEKPVVLSAFPGIADMLHFMDPNYVPVTRFLRDIREQTRMSSDAYVFPYTLQYVTTQPYIYYVEQIFKWGLGPFVSILTLIGLFLTFQKFADLVLRRTQDQMQHLHDKNAFIPLVVFCLLLCYGLYFAIIGRSAVKFMRYMLPLYPFFTILAGYGLSVLFHRAYTKAHTFAVMTAYKVLVTIFLMGILVWSLAFINIYTKRHTRIAATEWILANIPRGSTLAVEHWDDRVPIRWGERYQYQEMTIYELPDNERKWQMLMQKIEQSDYIILASNRLYTPLPKLADCKKFKVCYPLATQYYQKLFDGSLGFEKIKEFAAYPGLGSWVIRDDDADESFTVYEHPKVMIFRSTK